MPKDKESKEDIIKKLRQILDNPRSTKIKAPAFEVDKNLESIRKRLSGELSKTDKKYTPSDFLSRKYDNLEPRVTIHRKEEKITPSEIQKIEPKEQIEGVKDEFTEEDLFDDEDLYEIEKVDVTAPEFLEVISKETTKKQAPKTEVFLPIPVEKVKDTKVADEELPEWEAVGEEKPIEDKKEGKISEESPEFQKIEEKAELPADKIEEKISTWEPVSEEVVKEEIIEPHEGPKEEKPLPKEKERETIKAKGEKEQLKLRILSSLKERKLKKKVIGEEKLEPKKSVKPDSEIFVGGKESEENILKRLESKREVLGGGKEAKGVTEDIGESAEQQPIFQESFEKIEGEVERPSDETEEKIPTWEPVSEEGVKEKIIESPEKTKEEKPLHKEKEHEARIAEMEKKAELKRKKKEQRKKEVEEKQVAKEKARELRKKQKEEERLKRTEAKKALIAAREKEREARIAEREKMVELKTKEREQIAKQKEKQRLKKIKAKETLIAAREKEREARIAEREKMVELKTKEREQIAKQKEKQRLKKIKAKEALSEAREKEREEKKLKEIEAKKTLVATREKEREAKRAEKEKKAEFKIKVREQKAKEKEATTEKAAAPPLTYENEELTEWESYDTEEEIPEIEHYNAKPYTYEEYALYKKEIETSGNKKRIIHFFSKKKPDVGEATSLPDGFEVKLNKRTKVPYLRRKK